MEANNIRPFLIGICGGPLSGKSFLMEEIEIQLAQNIRYVKYH